MSRSPLARCLIFICLAFLGAMTTGSCLRWRLRAQQVQGTLTGADSVASQIGAPLFRARYVYTDAHGRRVQASSVEQTGRRPGGGGPAVPLMVLPEQPARVREAHMYLAEIAGPLLLGIALLRLLSLPWSWSHRLFVGAAGAATTVVAVLVLR